MDSGFAKCQNSSIVIWKILILISPVSYNLNFSILKLNSSMKVESPDHINPKKVVSNKVTVQWVVNIDSIAKVFLLQFFLGFALFGI